MKVVFMKFLRHFDFDVLLLGLLEKLALGLIKKLEAICEKAESFLIRAQSYRNGERR